MDRSLSIRIQPLAQQDIVSAYLWYENQRPGLGDDLLQRLDECFADILRNPRGYQLVEGPIRRALPRRFPYAVYFVLTETEAVVIAVLHGRRNPAALLLRP